MSPETLARRRPVWNALSELFLDTDTSLDRDWRIKILADSPYSLPELEHILIDEVYPICRFNGYLIAGEWAGFDLKWLEARILKRLVSPWRFLHPINMGYLTIPCDYEWKKTKHGILTLRNSVTATPTLPPGEKTTQSANHDI